MQFLYGGREKNKLEFVISTPARNARSPAKLVNRSEVREPDTALKEGDTIQVIPSEVEESRAATFNVISTGSLDFASDAGM